MEGKAGEDDRDGLPRCDECTDRIYLTSVTLPNGFKFNADGYLALQQFHVLRTTRLLHEVMTDIGAEAFRAAVDASPGLLNGLCAHDGTDANGTLRAGGAVPAVDISVESVEAYEWVQVGNYRMP